MKKRFIFQTSISLLAIILLFSCGKPLPPEWASLEGEWENPEVKLKISKEGDINYKRVSGNKDKVTINAGITEYSENGFTVSLFVKDIPFEVSKKPFKDDSTNSTKFVLDGRTLTRVGNFYTGQY